MSQASASPELSPTAGAHAPDASTSSADSEAALWLFGLTSSALLVASLLLLGLLASTSISDDAIGGFMVATSVVIAGIGLAALAYVVETAKRARVLHHASQALGSKPAQDEVAEGLVVVSAHPADLGRRRREQQAQQQLERSRQAKAIAATEVRQRPVPRAVASAVTMPQRPRPAPVRVPVRPQRTEQPVAPVFPRMPAPPARPRTQAVQAQLGAAEIRARAMRPPAPPPMPRPVYTRA